jgi:hypothetical protein
MSTTVVHKSQPHDVFIGRPTKWGNPFVIGRHGSRAEVIERYTVWVTSKPDLMAALDELKDKTLGCYCAPKPCHGDVLAALADGTFVWPDTFDAEADRT